MDLYPFSAAVFTNFGQAVILNFNCLSIDKEEVLFYSQCGRYFCPNWPGSSVPEAGHSHDEVSQPCLYLKISEGVFVSTVNRTFELLVITHVMPFHSYGKHSTGPSAYESWAPTYSKLFSRESVLTVYSYRAQSKEVYTSFYTYGRVWCGSLPRVRRYSLLYLLAVKCDY